MQQQSLYHSNSRFQIIIAIKELVYGKILKRYHRIWVKLKQKIALSIYIFKPWVILFSFSTGSLAQVAALLSLLTHGIGQFGRFCFGVVEMELNAVLDQCIWEPKAATTLMGLFFIIKSYCIYLTFDINFFSI